MARIVTGILAGGAAVVLFHLLSGIAEQKKDFTPRTRGLFIMERRELLLSALLFVFAAVRAGLDYGNGAQLALNFALLVGMTVLCLTDSRFYWVPGKVLLIMLVFWGVTAASVTVFCAVEEGLALASRSLGGAAFSGITFLILYLVTRGQLGGGDVKLSFILGLYLTVSRILPAILFGSVLSCIYALVQIARKKMGWKDGIPMVPFLWIGTVITVLLG